MKKAITAISLGGFLLLVLAACAPAKGRPAIPYLAKQKEIISAVAQFAPTLQFGSYNYFSIVTIGDNYITIRADPTSGASITSEVFVGYRPPPWRVTVTTLERGSITRVAISVLPAGKDFEKAADAVIKMLDQRFARAPEMTPGA